MACIVLFAFVSGAKAVPAGTLMGCTKPPNDLTDEKRRWCCATFNLACAVPVNDKQTVRGLQNRGETIEHDVSAMVMMKPLGGRCHGQIKCAVGLECRMGICLRRKDKAHLRELAERGKIVQMEEEMQDDGTDVETRDSLLDTIGQELFLHGQSVKVGSKIPKELLSSSEQEHGHASWPTHASDVQAVSKDQLDQAKSPSNDENNNEEDEISKNIAQLLFLKKGLRLSHEDISAIRALIAGTIDEREERDEQVEDATANAVEILTHNTANPVPVTATGPNLVDKSASASENLAVDTTTTALNNGTEDAHCSANDNTEGALKTLDTIASKAAGVGQRAKRVVKTILHSQL